MEQTVEIAGQTVSIHYSGNTLVSYDPIVYLHSLKGNGSEVWGQCQSLNCPPFTLISIPTPNWNNSLTPWKCEGLFAEDKPFEGNARQHLLQLETIVAKTEQHLETTPHHRCIAGFPRYKRSKNTQPPSSQRFAKNKMRCFVVSGKRR